VSVDIELKPVAVVDVDQVRWCKRTTNAGFDQVLVLPVGLSLQVKLVEVGGEAHATSSCLTSTVTGTAGTYLPTCLSSTMPNHEPSALDLLRPHRDEIVKRCDHCGVDGHLND
jgi:hypothetical protein